MENKFKFQDVCKKCGEIVGTDYSMEMLEAKLIIHVQEKHGTYVITEHAGMMKQGLEPFFDWHGNKKKVIK